MVFDMLRHFGRQEILNLSHDFQDIIESYRTRVAIEQDGLKSYIVWSGESQEGACWFRSTVIYFAKSCYCSSPRLHIHEVLSNWFIIKYWVLGRKLDMNKSNK